MDALLFVMMIARILGRRGGMEEYVVQLRLLPLTRKAVWYMTVMQKL